MDTKMQYSSCEPIEWLSKRRPSKADVILHQVDGKQCPSPTFNGELDGLRDFNQLRTLSIHVSRSRYHFDTTRRYSKPPRPECNQYDIFASREPRYIDDRYGDVRIVDEKYNDDRWVDEGGHTLYNFSRGYETSTRDHYRDHVIEYEYGNTRGSKYHREDIGC
ncbi:hypothetical protein DL98DRAFT_534779 [Cadophora sp. DSE1049]|nr:hypothetical protein DL98DRAFT_534779 [Cadophora sp. DSE1049]